MFALLTAIAVEALIDLVVEVGVPAILDVVAAGAIVWVLLRQHGARPDGAQFGLGEPHAPVAVVPPECRLAPTRVGPSAVVH